MPNHAGSAAQKASGHMRPSIFATSLSAKLLGGLTAGLLLSSLFFLILFVGIYRDQMARERGLVSEQVNRLLQTSLQNAMLKRDLPGLRDIVANLGRQPGIAGVMIVNPALEVRFASDAVSLGRRIGTADVGCDDCAGNLAGLSRSARLLQLPDGPEVMRSVNPIPNRTECKGCHGELDEHPVNGILIVDQATTGLRESALHAAGMMAGAGTSVMALALIGTWWFMHRTVVRPVMELEQASRALAGGNLEISVPTGRNRSDEIAGLCQSFNVMAASLRRSVDEIRDKERFLQAVIDTVPDGVRVIDQNYNVVLANRAYGELAAPAAGAAADASSSVAGPCYTIRGRSEPCPPTLTTCPFHAISESEPTIRYMHEVRSPRGGEAMAEITASRLETETEGKRTTFIVEAFRDLRQQIKFSHDQRLSELGQLATGVAHEIYNPLSSVRLGLLALDKRLATIAHGDEEVAEYLRIVNGQIDRCMDVTKRLLDLGHTPSSSLQLVSFTNIVPEVLSLLRFDAERIGIAIELDLGPRDLRVLATDSELRMLVLNLVQNAFHAMPSGGRLSVRGSDDGQKVVVELGDSGVGIAPEDLPHIFQPFFSKRADESQGSGLGLAICRAILARYGGKLEAQSTQGEGATFIITLPAAAAGGLA